VERIALPEIDIGIAIATMELHRDSLSCGVLETAQGKEVD